MIILASNILLVPFYRVTKRLSQHTPPAGRKAEPHDYGGNWETDTWDNTDVVYHLRSALTVPAGHSLTIVTGMHVLFWHDVTVAHGGTLTFQPGAIAKFGPRDSGC